MHIMKIIFDESQNTIHDRYHLYMFRHHRAISRDSTKTKITSSTLDINDQPRGLVFRVSDY